MFVRMGTGRKLHERIMNLLHDPVFSKGFVLLPYVFKVLFGVNGGVPFFRIAFVHVHHSVPKKGLHPAFNGFQPSPEIKNQRGQERSERKYPYSTQGAIKNLFGHLDRFAMELDVIQKMYSTLTTAAPVPETSKVPFTDDEIEKLWTIQNQEWVDTVLILLYSGWRITELLTLKSENVDLEHGTMKGGIKTRNGKDRIVPIHSKIQPFVEQWMNRGTEYLITDKDGKKMTDTQYRPYFKVIMEQLGFSHCPHECRHTLRSRLDSAGANKKCIDMILGHKSKDVGERVYTHKTVAELKAAIELISR